MSKKKISKQILRYGQWNHPNGKLVIDDEFASKLVNNFTRTPFSPVTRGHATDEKLNENPSLIVSKNITALEKREDGVYAEMELDESELDKYEDVSASIQPEYTDHETGEMLGPVLKHVALVVNPFIKGLKPFLPLAEDDKEEYLILLSDINMSKKEDIKTADLEEVKVEETETVEEVKTEETVVEEVTPEVEVKDNAVVVESAMADEIVEEPKVEEEKEITDEATQLSEIDKLKEELKQKNIELAEAKQKANKLDAENFYNTHLRAGKVLPVMQNEIIALASITEQTIDLGEGNTKSVKSVLESLFAKYPKLVNLEEQGVEFEKTPTDLSDIASVGIEMSPKEAAALKANYLKDNPNATDAQYVEYLKANKEILLKNFKK